MSLEINITALKRVHLCEVIGRIDSINAADLGAALSTLMDNGHNRIVIDLSGVEYLSSAGLRELVKARKRVTTGTVSGDVRIAAPSQRVLDVLQLAGVDNVFSIYETQVEAVGSF